MSLLRLPPDLQDSFEIVTRPRRLFSSSSQGVSGTVRVFPDVGTSLKEVPKVSNADSFNAENLEVLRMDCVNTLRSDSAAGIKASKNKVLNFTNQFNGDSFSLAGSSVTNSGTSITFELVDAISPAANKIRILRSRYASGSITVINTTNLAGTFDIQDTNNTIVTFSPDASSTSAAKVDATSYNFGTNGVSNTNTLASRLYASIALAKTNSDLAITATNPGGSSSVIEMSQDVPGSGGNKIIAGTAILTTPTRNSTTTGFRNGATFDDADIASLVAIAFTGGSALGKDLSGGSIGDTVDIAYASSGLGQAGISTGVSATPDPDDPRYLSVNSTVVGKSGDNITFTDDALGQIVSSTSYNASSVSLAGGFDSNRGSVEQYMNKVNELPQSVTRGKRMEILRFEPSFKLTSDTTRKRVITDSLFPYYAGVYPGASDFSFTNYHTVNFFDSPKVPTESVLIYPSPASGIKKSLYRPTGSFTLQCYINPRYTADAVTEGFRAGTILHMSSTFALSLVSGSAVDLSGKTSGYRLMLQLSHSAEVAPSSVNIAEVDAGTAAHPNDLIFLSKDNVLKKDVWEHVAVRWGTVYEQAGTGSFVIGGKESSTFVNASTTLGPESFGPHKGESSALFVGNYYDGQNSDIDLISLFFNSNTAKKDGIVDMWDRNYSTQDPRSYSFAHPLNAEVHELKIFDVYRNEDQITFDRDGGAPDLKDEGLLFYVPPYFMRATPERDVLVTPFVTTKRSTTYPFNVDMSFGVGGHLLNLENYVKDFKQNIFPRLLNLSASAIETSTDWATANAHLYASGSIRKRNLSILPNDNGKFIPDFGILEEAVVEKGTKWPHLYTTASMSSEEQLSLYVNDRKHKDLSIVTLRNYVPTGSSTFPEINQTDIVNSLEGPTPTDPFKSVDATGQVLAIHLATRDPDSQEVSFFDVSNIFYGSSVFENTFSLTDPAMTGSGGKVKVTLKDHNGILHRSDCTGSVATWNSAGAILYEEGLIAIKTPVLPLFGKEGFDCEFRGLNSIYSRRVSIPIDPGDISDSNNPTYISDLRPTDLAPDFDERFTYITDVDILDDNMNVVAKASFAQPVVKRNTDNFMIRCKLDF